MYTLSEVGQRTKYSISVIDTSHKNTDSNARTEVL
jgi:hypothetical protein